MAKALKIIGIIVLILALLIGVGIFLLIHFIDPNKLKDDISAGVYKATGRQLTINGHLSWSFFPWLGFKVNNISLSNAAGFGNQPFATADAVDISVRVMPLLSGKIAVNNIELDALQVNLVRNASGTTNWSDFSQAQNIGAKANNTASPTTSTPNSAPNINFSIANLTIVNGQIDWNDLQNKQHYTLSNVYINGSNVGTTSVFPLTISTKISSQQFSKPITISFNGQFNIASDLSSFAINQFDAKINSLELQGDISTKNSNNSFQGDLHLSPLNLPAFLADFNVSLPKMQKKNALQNITTDLAFNGDNNSISIKPLTITVDDSTLSGNVDVKNFKVPQVDFKLTSNQLNIDSYLPGKSKAQQKQTNATPAATASNNTAAPAAKQDTPINLPTAFLRTLQMQGQLNISQLKVANLHLSNLDVKLNAGQGVVKLAPINLNLYEGSATASLSLNVQNTTPNYQFTLDANKVQAEPFLNDLMNKDFITGAVKLSANLSTNGNTVNTLVGQLDGNSKFDFTNGVIKGINVQQQLASARALLNKQSPPTATNDNTTPFGDATGTINLNNGVATNNDFVLTSPGFSAKGKGTANLVTQSIDYQLRLISDKVDGLQGYQVPVNVKGALTSPNISLDTNDILQQVFNQQKKQLIGSAQKKLQEKLANKIDSKQVNDALGSLFG